MALAAATAEAETDVIPIRLGRMPQQAATLFPDDDWTGLSSPAERRKRQNRLNQRSYRKRKENASLPCPESYPGMKRSSKGRTFYVDIRPANSRAKPDSTSSSPELDLWNAFQTAAGDSELNRSELARTATLCKAALTSSQTIIAQFEKWVKQNQRGGSPKADQLLILVKFNIFRALIANSITLGFPAESRMEDTALSPFANPQWCQTNLVALPATLRPTKLQCEIAHHPWIDLLPIPRMRDNLLRAGETYDDLELCADLVGYFNSPVVRNGMIIWGEPWDAAGWEVTKEFLERWGWTIRGCLELFKSTNYWRSRRGERPLNFDKFSIEEVE
ncbi:hypothetical protein B0O99DRAFT_631527 [Bisporella sp. PMI_857]|nr:hypothetical protein B0O99DRAFT_631527 [Bisporella sp. PMI_857]